jgi:nucleoside phosphorylase
LTRELIVNSRELDHYDDDDLEACDVLILSAIEELENSAIERHLLRVGATPVGQTPYEQQYGFKRWKLAKPNEPEPLNVITKCLGSAGNGIAAVELSCFFLKPGMPRLVMFCGIAGSLNPSEAPLASVVVSSQCTWRGFDKISGDDVSREMRKKTIAVEPTDTRIVNPF